MLQILFSNQEYLLYLIGVMICTGIIKNRNLFQDFYSFLVDKIKSKKILITMISAISGILPIPGRVIVSAGLLDTVISDNNKSRWKFGILDYLATHHYYLWSPMEKTVIIAMGTLGISYLKLIILLLPLLIISLSYLLIYLTFWIKEEDIDIKINEDYSIIKILNILPIIFCITLMIIKVPAWLCFSLLSIYYLSTNKVTLSDVMSYINFKLVFFLASIIVISNFIKFNYYIIEPYLNNQNIWMSCGLIFIASFLLGSSSKYSGIVSLFTLAFGLKYFILFTCLGFSGYLLSPVHKCVMIGKLYFKTPLVKYYIAITIWCIVMLIYSLGDLIWR